MLAYMCTLSNRVYTTVKNHSQPEVTDILRNFFANKGVRFKQGDKTMIKRHPVLFFFPLAFLLSWYPWLLALIRGTGNGGPNPLGVFAAALITAGIVYGRGGVKDLLARLVRWRVGFQWWALVLLLPILVSVLSAAITVWMGAPLPTVERFKDWPELLDRFVFIFLFIGLGEEPGWRGFALNELQKKRTPLIASAILAPIWALWHLPLMGTEFPPAVIPAFLVSVVSATFVLTWIYNNTRGSILLMMTFHSMVNTIGAGFLFRMFEGPDWIRLMYINAGLWMVIAAFLLLSGKLAAVRAVSLAGSPLPQAT